jgi:hypothetical protein
MGVGGTAPQSDTDHPAQCRAWLGSGGLVEQCRDRIPMPFQGIAVAGIPL